MSEKVGKKVEVAIANRLQNWVRTPMVLLNTDNRHLMMERDAKQEHFETEKAMKASIYERYYKFLKEMELNG